MDPILLIRATKFDDRLSADRGRRDRVAGAIAGDDEENVDLGGIEVRGLAGAGAVTPLGTEADRVSTVDDAGRGLDLNTFERLLANDKIESLAIGERDTDGVSIRRVPGDRDTETRIALLARILAASNRDHKPDPIAGSLEWAERESNPQSLRGCFTGS